MLQLLPLSLSFSFFFFRVISDYCHNAQHGEIESRVPLEQLYFENKTLILDHFQLIRGLYADQLKNWFRYFNRSQLFILEADDLINNPYNVLHQIETFLNLPHFFTQKNFYVDKKKGFYCFKDSGGHQCLGKSKGNPHPNVPGWAMDQMREFFKPHNAQLYKLLGRNFSWM